MSHSSPKKIVVTGGLGFIGSHTVVELQQQGFEVIIIDDLSNSSKEVLNGIFAITHQSPTFAEIDLKDKKGGVNIKETLSLVKISEMVDNGQSLPLKNLFFNFRRTRGI